MQYASLIILWGANVLETRQGNEVPQRLVEAKKRGAQIVVIVPRHSATVKQSATWWIPIRPGTDAALMLVLLYVLIDENLLDRPFIRAHSVGFDERCVSRSAYLKISSPVWFACWKGCGSI
ncbi:MAG: molybdopterin-dependent oxidoreductase [Anaerolineaceae bacterium]|jgi:anaerobic dimethyl sulfoxide reductase subunit A